MIAVSIGDIIDAASLAWQIYQLAFDSENSANRHFKELVEDIRDLAQNLDSICEIVKNAGVKWQTARQPRRTTPQKEWELTSIQQIVGDYKATLKDCKKLLDENPEFRAKRGPLRNVEYNLVFRPKAEKLQKRLSAHNNKILILLKPLEFTLLSNVRRELVDMHSDLANRIGEVHTSVMKLQGLLISDVAQAMLETEQRKGIDVKIPEHVERKFLETAAGSHPEIRDLSRFPLQLGADSYIEHFENSTKTFKAGRFLVERTPEPEQYLNLLKCVWILKRIECSDAFMKVCEGSTDSQWPGYINQLHEDLNAECQRFTASSTQTLLVPNLNVSFEESQYEIWVEEDLASFFSMHTQNLQPPIMRIPVTNETETLNRELIIYPVSQTLYRLVGTIKDTNAPEKFIPPLEMDIDLEKFSFLPLYATPSSSNVALKVVLDSGSKCITPEFQDIKYIYRLQHLLTGYKVYDRYDQAMVKVSFVISSQSETIREHGRVQLWLPEPFTKVTPDASTKSTTSVQQSALSSMTRISRYENGRISGRTATPSDQSTLGPLPNLRKNPSNSTMAGTAGISLSSTNAPTISRKPVPAPVSSSSVNRIAALSTLRSPAQSGRGSIMTASTADTTASQSTVTTFTTINTGMSTQARLHAKPLKPLLVIFIKSKNQPARLSIVAIEIDDLTSVVRERCECRSSDTRCKISCIERNNGHMLAQRWDAGDNLAKWDIAMLGTTQRSSTEARWDKLKRVSLEFERWEGSPCKCSVATTHELSKCNLSSHNGLFGIVKQIGTQRLLSYHDQRDRRSAVITGRLPGDDNLS